MFKARPLTRGVREVVGGSAGRDNSKDQDPIAVSKLADCGAIKTSLRSDEQDARRSLIVGSTLKCVFNVTTYYEKA